MTARPSAGAVLAGSAAIFSALGDATRLGLVARLGSGGPQSIARLTGESRVTRQAITKHLLVLERAGLVRSERQGRETRLGAGARSARSRAAVSRPHLGAVDRTPGCAGAPPGRHSRCRGASCAEEREPLSSFPLTAEGSRYGRISSSSGCRLQRPECSSASPWRRCSRPSSTPEITTKFWFTKEQWQARSRQAS